MQCKLVRFLFFLLIVVISPALLNATPSYPRVELKRLTSLSALSSATEISGNWICHRSGVAVQATKKIATASRKTKNKIIVVSSKLGSSSLASSAAKLKASAKALRQSGYVFNSTSFDTLRRARSLIAAIKAKRDGACSQLFEVPGSGGGEPALPTPSPLPSQQPPINPTLQTPNGIEIITPSTGARIPSGQVLLRAQILGSGSISQVQFLLDGLPLGQPLLSPPYSLLLNTTGYSSGQHQLSVEALTGNASTLSHSVTVLFDPNFPFGQSQGVLNQVVQLQPLSPPTAITAIAGDVINFDVSFNNPNNRVNNYSIGLLGVAPGTLPTSAIYSSTQNNFYWPTALSQAGQYSFRITASDDFGDSGQNDVTINLQPRTAASGPAFLVRRGYFSSGNFLASNSTIEITQFSADPDLRIDLLFPPGASGAITSVSGLPAGVHFSAASIPGIYRITGVPSYNSPGNHQVHMIASTNQGGQSEYYLNFVVHAKWDDSNMFWLTPKVNGTSTLLSQAKQSIPPLTVSGNVSLQTDVLSGIGNPVSHPSDLWIRFEVDNQVVSAPKRSSDTFVWDSTSVADGTHVLSVVPLYSNVNNSALTPRSMAFGVHNGASFPRPNDPQSIWVATPAYLGIPPSQVPVRINYPGYLPRGKTHPLIPRLFPPPSTTTEIQDAYNVNKMVGQPIVKGAGLYQPQPRFYVNNQRDLVVSAGYYERFSHTDTVSLYSTTAPNVVETDYWCGARGDGSFSAYSGLRGVLDTWVAAQEDGRIYRIDFDGKISTIWGKVNLNPVVSVHIPPPIIFTQNILPLTLRSPDWVIVGSGTDYPQLVTDFEFDPSNLNILYIVDSKGNSIFKLDLNSSRTALINPGNGTATLTRFAGTGLAGSQDGSLLSASFNEPKSITAMNGKLYVSDRRNCTIRQIDLQTNTVSTVAGFGSGTCADPTTVVPSLFPSNSLGNNPIFPLSAKIPSLMSLRANSQGKLIGVSNNAAAIFEFDLQAQTQKLVVTRITGDTATIPNDEWLWGEVGYGDYIIVPMSHALGNATIKLYKPDGTDMGSLMYAQGNMPDGRASGIHPDLSTHYPWATAVHRDHNAIAKIGDGSTAMIMYTPIQPGEIIPSDDVAKYRRGESIWQNGTTPEFPWGSRSSFAAFLGYKCDGRLGLDSCDDLGLQYQQDTQAFGAQAAYNNLANKIHSGLGGSEPRPEITGRNLDDLIYWILRTSIYRPFSLPSVQLTNAIPEVRNLNVHVLPESTPGFYSLTFTWSTDIETSSVIVRKHDGVDTDTSFYKVDGFTKNHSYTMNNVKNPGKLYFEIINQSRDGVVIRTLL